MSAALLERIRAIGVVPVIVIDDPAHALPLADALAEGGLPIAEITFRTKAAAEAIGRIARERLDFLVGAGTLLDAQSIGAAVNAGSQFGLAPGYDGEVVAAARASGMPFYPGFATPSELSVATRLGSRTLKFFPAAKLGGPDMLKAVIAPFAHLGLSIIPTGGVTVETIPDWLAVKEIVAVGGTWIATPADMAGGNWAGITAKARAAVDAVARARG